MDTGSRFAKRFKKLQVNSKKNSNKWMCIFGKRSSGRVSRVLNLPTEHGAAVRIQTAFRAYKAKKCLRRLRGTVRFKALIEAQSIEKQSSITLDYIHSWSKIQSEIIARRVCMVMNGRLRQKKAEHQLKLEAKLNELEVEWCGGTETMEEILSRIQQRVEAAVKRERAMAYAFSHQWRAHSGHYFGQAYYGLCKENWGWSWTERWVAICPWITRIHVRSTKLPPKKLITTGKPMKTCVAVKGSTTKAAR